MINFSVVLVAALLSSTSPLIPDRVPLSQIQTYLDAAHQFWGFEGSALVSRNGHVLFSQGYGLANHQFSESNTPETRFFISSISKQFTAAAILILQQDGLLKLTDPITKYLKDYPAIPGKQITIRHLLTHTSGIPNYTDEADLILNRTSPISPEELIDKFKSLPLDFKPGTAIKYSNSGYVLLGKIIEVISGQSYEAYINHRILKPSGMLRSGYGRREASIPDRAEGYTAVSEGVIVDALPIDFSVLFSAGALYSTVLDLAKWDHTLYTDSILNSASKAAMFSPQAGNYGYGWIVDSKFGRRHVYHGGFLDGFNTSFNRWIDDSLCVVVLSNEDEAPVSKIANGLAEIMFDEPYEMPMLKTPIEADPKSFAEYDGVYLDNSGTYRFVSLEQDTLYTHLRGMPRRALLPESKDTFFYRSDNTSRVAFVRDKLRQVKSLTTIDEGISQSANKLTGSAATSLLIDRNIITLDSLSLRRFEGRYDIESEFGREYPGFPLLVTVKNDHLSVKLGDNEQVDVFPSTPTCFFYENADLQISFLLDDSSKVIECIIQMGGIKVHGLRTK